MALAVVLSRAQVGVQAPQVTVEVHLENTLPGLSIVGLPETAVKESKDRVRAAIRNSGFDFPLRYITINLAPADLPKEGGRFDLPIAIGILAASEQVSAEVLKGYEMVGELALGGELRAVRGVLPMALKARESERALIVPTENADEATLAQRLPVFAVSSLKQLCAHLAGLTPISPHQREDPLAHAVTTADLADVKGQHRAKRALEVAAAGAHNLLMVGPPGSGKTMLASRLPGILPALTEQEALESAALYSISHQGFDPTQWGRRPFRAPHHTVSGVALVGGGSQPRPGEVSLAHHGVLFLDELAEFDRRALEVLREPLETGQITISRAQRSADFPARFQLVAAMNPVSDSASSRAVGRGGGEEVATNYRRLFGRRISQPLLDRIDIQIEVPPVPREYLRPDGRGGTAESSAVVRERVQTARALQIERAGKPNAALGSSEVDRFCRLLPAVQQLLERAADQLGLSARGHHRILKMARTIADLDRSEPISAEHLSEALSYRRLERTR